MIFTPVGIKQGDKRNNNKNSPNGRSKFMFMGNKKKRHPLLAVAVGGLAIFGAYSLVLCAKNMCCSCKEKVMNLMKFGKNKGECMDSVLCECDSDDE